MRKAIIFDFDGVVINSTEVQKLAFTESYKLVVGYGEASFEEFMSHSGDSLQSIFMKMKLPMEMIEPYRRISRENIGCVAVYEGVRELIYTLKDEGYICALCTGKDRERTLELLSRLRFNGYFEVIVCSDDVSNPKPHPESLIKVLEQLKVKNKNALMIGDAKNDILCAKGSGVDCIAVTWGEFNKAELEKEKPGYIADTVSELYGFINEKFGTSISGNVFRADIERISKSY